MGDVEPWEGGHKEGGYVYSQTAESGLKLTGDTGPIEIANIIRMKKKEGGKCLLG